MSDDDIVGLNIPTAQPLVYHELDADLKPLALTTSPTRRRSRARQAAVAAQGKARGLTRVKTPALAGRARRMAPLCLPSPCSPPSRSRAPGGQGRSRRGAARIARPHRHAQARDRAHRGDRAEAADSLKESERTISEANRSLRELGGQRQETQSRLAELTTRSEGR